jgi:hypothetical protein
LSRESPLQIKASPKPADKFQRQFKLGVQMSQLIRAATLIIILTLHGPVRAGENKKESDQTINLSPFGSNPIQLSLDKDGIKQKKEPGFICELDAINGHYSEWGETEKDARTIVMNTCSDKSGLLLCKKDKITCKEDKH